MKVTPWLPFHAPHTYSVPTRSSQRQHLKSLKTLSCVAAISGSTFGLAQRQRHRLASRNAKPPVADTQLTASAAQLLELQQQWLEIPLEDVPKAQELMQREMDLRQELKECPYGDPADTWTPVTCDHPVVSAHNQVTKALILVELGKLQWMVKCGEALGHEDLKSERGNFADLLLKMAELHLRLFEVRESYELLQRAKALIPKASRRQGILCGLLDNCWMCECLKTTPSMFGAEITPASDAANLLANFGKLLVESNYHFDRILDLTGAETLIDFSNDEQLPVFAQHLRNQMEKDENLDTLWYLIRLFLLRLKEPLEDLLLLVGADCCKLLLELQVITALRDGNSMSIEEATSAMDESAVQCFSNIRLWPLQNLIIATDAQTWPYGEASERFEPVMYLSDDSLALLDASPEVEGLNILDMCCGSGVQGISALARNAASVTFSDVNPRALRFVRFNLAMNRLLNDSCNFCLGDTYAQLDGQKFHGILANPPFLPNPDGIASQAIALYGNGGAFGEDVLSSIVEGCSKCLLDGGWLMLVTYAPNVEQMPSRLQGYLAPQSAECIQVAAGNQKDAADFIPVASEVEYFFYPKALKETGVETLSEALAFIRLRNGEEGECQCTLDLRKELFADQSYVKKFGRLTQPNDMKEAV